MHTILALLFHTLTWLNLIIPITPAQTWLNPIGRNPCCSDVPLLPHSFYISPTRSLLACTAAVDKFSNWLCVRSYVTQSVGYLCICAYNTYTCIIHSICSYFFTYKGHCLYYLSLWLLSFIDVCSCTFD